MISDNTVINGSIELKNIYDMNSIDMALRQILEEFLSMPVENSQPVFDKFISINNSIFRQNSEVAKSRFVYIPGAREDRIVLVAHADTVFDDEYCCLTEKNTKYLNDENIYSMGSDDRAGCAMIWAFRESGNSILITDGEEIGGLGSKWIMEHNPDIADEINNHSFMIELDRKNGNEFKTYNVGTEAFTHYIKQKTSYVNAGKDSYTDICTLCRDVCGVNISVGYYKPHLENSYVNFLEWLNTYYLLSKLFKEFLPKYIR